MRRAPRVEVQDGAGHWRAEREWPPAGVRAAVVALHAGTYADEGGNEADHKRTDCPGALRGDPQCAPQEQNGVGAWSFTGPARAAVRIAGAPTVSVEVASSASTVNVIALLYDVAPDGTATLVTRGSALGGGPAPSSFALYPQDWPLAAGHRLGLLISGADDWWFTPGSSLSQVRVLDGRLTIPLAACAPGPSLAGGPSTDMQYRGPFPVAAGTISAAMVAASRPPPRAAACARSR